MATDSAVPGEKAKMPATAPSGVRGLAAMQIIATEITKGAFWAWTTKTHLAFRGKPWLLKREIHGKSRSSHRTKSAIELL